MGSLAIQNSEMQPKVGAPVAVIIPCFNAAATLPRAISSVLSQSTLPQQIIFVDDASTDNTKQIIEKFCAEHSQFSVVKVYLATNLGAASARNHGWARATVPFIAFLDCDDGWHPQKLEIQWSWLAAHPEVMLCGHECVVTTESAESAQLLVPEQLSITMYPASSFLLKNRLSTPSVMLRTAIPERFVDGKRYSEDYLLWVQIAMNYGAIAFIRAPLAFLYKSKFGDSGLSANLWQMQRGELDTLARISNSYNPRLKRWLYLVSWIKFSRRCLIKTGSILRAKWRI